MKKNLLFMMVVLIAPFGAYGAPQIASGAYVEQRIGQKIDERTVQLTGEQEINGVKDFKDSPEVPTPALPTE